MSGITSMAEVVATWPQEPEDAEHTFARLVIESPYDAARLITALAADGLLPDGERTGGIVQTAVGTLLQENRLEDAAQLVVVAWTRLQQSPTDHARDELLNRLSNLADPKLMADVLRVFGHMEPQPDFERIRLSQEVKATVRNYLKGSAATLSWPRDLSEYCIRLVEADLEARSWEVKPAREAPFDLIARQGDREMHIDVKGSTGDHGYARLTERQSILARSDPSWRLAFVFNVAWDEWGRFHSGKVIIVRGPIRRRLTSDMVDSFSYDRM